jgi:hypothetical protein
MKVVGMLVLLVAVAGLLMGQAMPKDRTVEAERIIVSDARGKARVVIEEDSLRLFDKGENLRAVVGLKDNDTPAFAIFDEKAKAQAGLTMKNGWPFLHFNDKAGKLRAELSLVGGFQRLSPMAYSEAFLAFYDADEKLRVDLGSGGLGGRSNLHFLNEEGGFDLGLVGSPVSSVLFVGNPKGGNQIRLDALRDSSRISLLDNAGTSRAVLGRAGLVDTQTGTTTHTAESSLVLFDKDGKVFWRVP